MLTENMLTENMLTENMLTENMLTENMLTERASCHSYYYSAWSRGRSRDLYRGFQFSQN